MVCSNIIHHNHRHRLDRETVKRIGALCPPLVGCHATAASTFRIIVVVFFCRKEDDVERDSQSLSISFSHRTGRLLQCCVVVVVVFLS
jgi:hypothetical protein